MPNLLKSNKLKKSIVIAKKNRSMTKKARPMSKKVKSKSKKTRSKGKKTRSISKRVRSKLPSKKTYQHGGVSFTFSNAIDSAESISVDTSGEKIISGSNKVIWVQPDDDNKVISIELLTDDCQVEGYNLEKAMSLKMADLEIGPVIYNIELFDLGDENRDNKEKLESIFGRTELIEPTDAGDEFRAKYNSIFSENPPGRQILAVTKMDKLESFLDDCYKPAIQGHGAIERFGDGINKPNKEQCIDVFKSLKDKTNKMWGHKIAHRDLHAGNMMYKKHQDGTFEGYLIDWGHAKKYDPKENKEYVVGIEKTENEQARFDVTLAMLFSGSNDANGGFKAGFKSHDLY